MRRRLLDGDERVLRVREPLREEFANALPRGVGIREDDDTAPLVCLFDVVERLRLQAEAARDDAVCLHGLADGDDVHLALDDENFFDHFVSS